MPEPTDIQITRKLGHGLIVDTAPHHTRMTLHVLAEASWGARLQGPDLINIADQVLYRVTGYDPESATLLLELVEDWRQPGVITFNRKLTEAEITEFRTEWTRRHGGHVREALRQDEEESGA